MEAIRNFFERMVPFLNWREESEMLSFKADLAEEWPTETEQSAKSEESDSSESSAKTSSRTPAGVKNADGSAKK